MKIVKIQGGLGNQMFQYAFACKLKHLFPLEKILIDITNYKGQTGCNYELDNVFNIDLYAANPFQLSRFTLPFSTNTKIGSRIHAYIGKFCSRNIYTEKKTNYFAFTKEPLDISESCYYAGYWINEEYFHDIKDEIMKTFSFKRPLNSYCHSIKKAINDTNSVSIHVRRGDYLLFDAYKGICDKRYYEKAIAYIKEHVESPHFYIFSNDLQWCRENLSNLMDTYTFVDNNEPKNNYMDMQLMSYCKHNIIAHSSFSWWGAWLNSNPNKIVVAPYKWVNSKDITHKPQLNDWFLIDQST